MFTVEQEAGSKKPTRISILPTQKVEHSEAERKGVEVGFCGGHVPARLNHRPTVTVFCVYMMWEEYFSHHTPKCPATAQVCWWNADYRCWIRSLSDTWRRLGSLLRVCGLVQRGQQVACVRQLLTRLRAPAAHRKQRPTAPVGVSSICVSPCSVVRANTDWILRYFGVRRGSCLPLWLLSRADAVRGLVKMPGNTK